MSAVIKTKITKNILDKKATITSTTTSVLQIFTSKKAKIYIYNWFDKLLS